jgi:hypothetical protein
MRARSLKPGLFKNELLGTADPLLTVLFTGLWCEADREGRLEDRPLRIRAEVFPYRHDLDIEPHLQWLHNNFFIVRYIAKRMKLIQVLAFSEHQRPHVNEAKSVLPPMSEKSTTKVASQHYQGSASAQPKSEHFALNPSSLTPDSGLLTPESGLMTPESKSEGSRGKRAIATRIPDDFELTGPRMDIAVAEGVDPVRTIAKFVDYWKSASGPKARKLDWEATWRNWCRTESDRNRPRRTRFDELKSSDPDAHKDHGFG